ncbi:MAG: M20/M25/M40 family metallo-hydrolase, partial [Deltaproteobacteria bacterium]
MNGRAFSAGLLLLAALLAATWLGLEPPSPVPSSAPPGSFSAERALPRLRRVLDAAGDGVPHPAGSEAGRRVRDAVVAELRALGIEPRVVDSLTCNRYLTCTPVSNVIARIPGRARGPAVLVSAHHDSVPAGPGAADDGSGVAIVLELARALRAEPAGADVILLVDDAEEAGLGGAEAFLNDPAAREVGAIVNLEARGTGGPSLLFETTGGSAAIVRRFAEGARRPMGSSLLSTVYRLLPNDTNLTVLRRLGVPGANLAFVDGAVRYHTPRDDLAHLDPRSVQHQGENALGLVRAFSGPIAAEGAAVWFDLLGLVVVRFPEGLALPAALAALFLALGAAVADARRGLAGAGRIALGALALP